MCFCRIHSKIMSISEAFWGKFTPFAKKTRKKFGMQHRRDDVHIVSTCIASPYFNSLTNRYLKVNGRSFLFLGESSCTMHLAAALAFQPRSATVPRDLANRMAEFMTDLYLCGDMDSGLQRESSCTSEQSISRIRLPRRQRWWKYQLSRASSGYSSLNPPSASMADTRSMAPELKAVTKPSHLPGVRTGWATR